MDFTPQTKLFAPSTNCRCFASKHTKKKKTNCEVEIRFGYQFNGFHQTATRTRLPGQWQHDSKRCTQTAQLKSLVVLFKDLELACTLRNFVFSFSTTFVPSSTHRAMFGHKAHKPDAPKSVKKQGFSLDEKCESWTRARKASYPRRLQERLDMPRILFTPFSLKMNWKSSSPLQIQQETWVEKAPPEQLAWRRWSVASLVSPSATEPAWHGWWWCRQGAAHLRVSASVEERCTQAVHHHFQWTRPFRFDAQARWALCIIILFMIFVLSVIVDWPLVCALL